MHCSHAVVVKRCACEPGISGFDGGSPTTHGSVVSGSLSIASGAFFGQVVGGLVRVSVARCCFSGCGLLFCTGFGIVLGIVFGVDAAIF